MFRSTTIITEPSLEHVNIVRFETFDSARFVEPHSRICLQQLQPGVFVDDAKFCLLGINDFYRCTVHFDIHNVHTPTNALFIKPDKILNFTLL